MPYSVGQEISPLLHGEVRAMAVHAGKHIKAFEPILLHYGKLKHRHYEVGRACKPVAKRQCQTPAGVMGMLPLPADAYVALA